MFNSSDINSFIIFWSWLHTTKCCSQEWSTSIASVIGLLKRLICILTKIVGSDVKYRGMGTSVHTPISYITAVEVKKLIVGTWKNETSFYYVAFLPSITVVKKKVLFQFMICQYSR